MPRSSVRGVPGEQIGVEVIEWLGRGNRKRLGRRRRRAVDELRERCVGDQRRVVGAEVVIVNPQAARAYAELKLMAPHGPCEVIVDLEPRGAAPLHPVVVQASDWGERRARPRALSPKLAAAIFVRMT